ncbi:MAG: DegT/DnrJ/EryC1/StrS family aminotransferase [candidate division Zixibacteria bacterium]|nr:DegT/DnrJ/EryC1/StrS family aminotransferase [candidate division Zixibacteria bacterium]
MGRTKVRVPLFNLTLGREEKKAVQETLNSGWLTSGPRCAEFERLIVQKTGAPYAVALSSATAGLHLSLVALDIGRGDEVIVPSYTFAATVSSIIMTGATPVFCDIDSSTLNLDPVKVDKAVTRKTRAIISVDIAGRPCDYRALVRICKKYRLKLVCDAAHSLGASYNKKPIGSFGDATVFSFYATKNVTTGEGGMVVTSRKALAERIRKLSLHGITVPTQKRNKAGSWRYDIIEMGYKSNLSDINAALGVAQTRKLKQFALNRRRAEKRYFGALRNLTDFIDLPALPKDSESSWSLFIIKLKLERLKIGRDRFIEEMKKRGIICGVHFILFYFVAKHVLNKNVVKK